MNSIGIGITVGLGAAIGLMLVASSASVVEYVATAVIYGFFAGIIYELTGMLVVARRNKPPYRR